MREKEFVFNDEWLIEEVEGDAILFSKQKNVIVAMNEAGLNIIKILREKKEFDILVEKYKDIYYPNGSIEEDLKESLNKLIEIGVIAIV